MTGRETTPFWWAERKLKTYPALRRNQEVDVCIIGKVRKEKISFQIIH